MTNGPDKSASQIRYVRLPKLTLGGWGMAAMGIILAFASCPSMMFLNCALDSPQLRRAPEPVRTALCGLIMIVPPALGVFWFSTLHRSWIRNRSDIVARKQRITRLLNHASADQRFWHRAAEYVLTGEYPSGKLYQTAMSKMPVGAGFCLNSHENTYPWRPHGNDLAFEPIEIVDEVELQDLIRADFEGSNPSRALRSQWGRRVDRRRRTTIVRVAQWIGNSILVLMLLRHLYLAITGGVVSQVWLWAFPMLAIIAGLSLSQVREKQFWVVPGGVIHRSAPFYRKRMRFAYFTRRDSVLAVDFRSKLVTFFQEKRSMSIVCSEIAAMAVIVAWLSTARSPTDAEVRSFLGLPTESRGTANTVEKESADRLVGSQ